MTRLKKELMGNYFFSPLQLLLASEDFSADSFLSLLQLLSLLLHPVATAPPAIRAAILTPARVFLSLFLSIYISLLIKYNGILF
jgi:hypothetical protein